MTLKLLFDNTLKELSKVNAPSMLLEDFNYFINKSFQSYINKRYNSYDINQQTSDDLRVLKSTAILDVKKCEVYDDTYMAGASGLYKGTYEVELPQDYMHMLNCIVVYKITGGNHSCYNEGDYVQFAARRLTSDAWSTIINDYYNRPLPQRPYYFIHNVNLNDLLSTNPYLDNEINGRYKENRNHETDRYGEQHDGTDMDENGYKVEVRTETDENGNVTILPGTHGRSNFRRKIKLNNGRNIDNIDREAGFRYGNASKVRCEIRFGNDDSVYVPVKVMVDYIKAPQFYRLTLEQVDLTRDTSMVLEFPDYQCYEIINELVTILMENTADPRLQTHSIVSQSIENPVQQLTPQLTVPATQQAASARAAAAS